MNSFFCWLTGGHKYADSNLMIHTDHETDEAVFENICIKCGKPFETRIGWRYLSIMHKCPRVLCTSVQRRNEHG